jgi:hypothetical protein
MASFTTADPDSNNKSKGTVNFLSTLFFLNNTTSPGYNSSVYTFNHLPILWTQTSNGDYLIDRSLFIFYILCITTVPSKVKSINNVNKLKYQYSSINHKALQNI